MKKMFVIISGIAFALICGIYTQSFNAQIDELDEQEKIEAIENTFKVRYIEAFGKEKFNLVDNIEIVTFDEGTPYENYKVYFDYDGMTGWGYLDAEDVMLA